MKLDPKILLNAYRLDKETPFEIDKYGGGHIHHTYMLRIGDRKFILQEFNQKVFPQYHRIANNQNMVMSKANLKDLDFQLPLPIRNVDGELFSKLGDQLFRLYPFVHGQCIPQVHSNLEASLSAEAFAAFIKACSGIDVKEMAEIIPGFHDLQLRYQQLETAIGITQVDFNDELENLVRFYLDQKELVARYKQFMMDLPLRVTHNDTKINNLIFSEDFTKVEALIDLDTIMPGLCLFDFGDLVRTVCCTVDENSQTWKDIHFDLSTFEALLKGFLKVGKDFMTKEEILSLSFGGEMMTYIMGLRFLADYLNGNIYYNIHYADHNLHRAINQSYFLRAQMAHRTPIRGLILETMEKDM
ncbi:phosphotransferase enzyme family protein [Pararhodonellum marinum]|uniref:phosphotransferase enzyme family protein n=1 Tax=Pararhodonellum marinum TaxID=2755358 RepID=UPI0018907776|nr:aminoglycoside phosphotransferase family protein [Pararhodonellum marinum]